MADRIDQPDEIPDAQPEFQVCSWEPDGGLRVVLAILSPPGVEESFQQRNTQNKRPYRDGAQLQNTGADPIAWSFVVVVNSTVSEPGLGHEYVYPDYADRITKQFWNGATGTLTLPTRGPVRAKLDNYRRVDNPIDGVDTAVINAAFTRDNEEKIDAAAIQKNPVKGSHASLATQTKDSADREGANPQLVDVREWLSDVAGLINAPGDAIEDIDVRRKSIERGFESVFDALDDLGEQVGGAGSVFDNGFPETTFSAERARDAVANAEQERAERRGRIQGYAVQRDTSLSALAQQLGQDYQALLDLNSARVADPSDVREGDRILIYA